MADHNVPSAKAMAGGVHIRATNIKLRHVHFFVWLLDASKTAKIASKTPPRLPNRLPNAFLAPKISSKPVKTSPRGLQMPPRRSISLPRPSKMFGSFFKSLLPCQVHAKSLPGSEIRQRFLSAMAKHDGRLPSPWPLTKGGLAVVRPRRASSILILHWVLEGFRAGGLLTRPPPAPL